MTTNDPHDRRPWRTDDEWTRLHARLTTANADEQLSVTHRGRVGRLWPALAAAVVIGAVGFTITRRVERASTAAPTEQVVTTKPGERTTIRLADSSIITLAPATTIRLTGDASRREVQLDGMADFTVRHDPRRTFVVRAGDAVTTDIGTQFVIRAYASDSGVSVAVSEGSVKVQSQRDSASSITLAAGEVAQVRGGSASKLATTSAPLYATWTDGRLSFDNAPLAAVAADLERWFDVDIRLPTALGRRRVSAIYNEATLNGVLDALSATVGFTYSRDGRVVTIRERSPR